MQLVKRECVSQTTKRKTLPALNESIEKVKKNTNEAQRREETNSIIQHFGERKKAASMETEWRMGSVVKARRGLGFLALEGEVDACRYCTLAARWMSCFTTAKRCRQSGLRKMDLPIRVYSHRFPSCSVVDGSYSAALGQFLTIGGTCARGYEP